MKVIKDEDLLYLHYQIEKAEVQQKKLEDSLKEKTDKLKKSKKSNRFLGSLILAFFLLTVFLVANSFYFSKRSKANKTFDETLSVAQKELLQTREELTSLKQEKYDLQQIKDLYLYRSLINKDTVYSVQVKAFNTNKVPSISKKYTNSLFYNDSTLYRMSLGIFETLHEAQEFRKTLMESGFDERIFVISYKEGKRLKIEDFQ